MVGEALEPQVDDADVMTRGNRGREVSELDRLEELKAVQRDDRAEPRLRLDEEDPQRGYGTAATTRRTAAATRSGASS